MADQVRAFTTAELLQHTTWPSITRAVNSGNIERVLPGLYSSPLHAQSWRVRAEATMLWNPLATLTGPSALRLWGLESVPGDNVHIVTTRPEHRQCPQWLSVRRSDVAVPSGDIAGFRVHEPAYALAVGHGLVAPRDRAEFVYGAFRQRLVTADALAAALASLPRVVGRRALVARAEKALVGIESYLEEKAWANILSGKLGDRFVRQHTVTVAGQRFRLDAFHPSSRTAIEFDGAAWHSGEARSRDIRRDTLLAVEGILTVRLGYDDVMSRPAWCKHVIDAVVANRSRLEVIHHQRARLAGRR